MNSDTPNDVEKATFKNETKPVGEEEKTDKKEEKKVLSKFYGSTNIRKLPKIPKSMMKDLENITPLTPEQLESYLTGVVLGLIPERFGLESALDTRINAAKELSRLKEMKQRNKEVQDLETEIDSAREIVYQVRDNAASGGGENGSNNSNSN